MLLTQLVMAGLSHKALQVNFGKLNFSLVSLPVASIICNLTKLQVVYKIVREVVIELIKLDYDCMTNSFFILFRFFSKNAIAYPNTFLM